MTSTIHFYEIDGGPSGIFWEGRVGDDGPYLGTWVTTHAVLEVARIMNLADHRIRFHTQAEWELDSQLEEMLGG
jgi:hypothetical protein